MAIDLNQLRIFVTVAELGAMTKAAKALKMPVSRVSRTIGRLEATLGTTLMQRTTRSLSITEAGRRLHQTSWPLMRQIRAIEDEFQASTGTVQGLVRVTAPEDVGSAIVAPALAELSEIYPALQIEIICSDERLDLVRAGIDIGLRMGKLQDSALKSRRLGSATRSCVAAPEYLSRAGTPKDPEDLLRHDLIQLLLGDAVADAPWIMTNGKRRVTLPVKPRFTVNHTAAGLALALKQRGIIGVPTPMIMDHLSRGDLVQVLPQWSFSSTPVHLIFPRPRHLAPKVKVVLDFLEERLKGYF